MSVADVLTPAALLPVQLERHSLLRLTLRRPWEGAVVAVFGGLGVRVLLALSGLYILPSEGSRGSLGLRAWPRF